MSTKAERKKQELEKHYNALENLAKLCGIEKPDGKKLSTKLLKLENIGHGLTLRKCNDSTMTNEDFLNDLYTVEEEVRNLFNRKIKGFDTNTDPRGHCLKIDDEVMRSEYSQTGLFTDFVGNGLLAPTIDGTK